MQQSKDIGKEGEGGRGRGRKVFPSFQLPLTPVPYYQFLPIHAYPSVKAGLVCACVCVYVCVCTPVCVTFEGMC